MVGRSGTAEPSATTFRSPRPVSSLNIRSGSLPRVSRSGSALKPIFQRRRSLPATGATTVGGVAGAGGAATAAGAATGCVGVAAGAGARAAGFGADAPPDFCSSISRVNSAFSALAATGSKGCCFCTEVSIPRIWSTDCSSPSQMGAVTSMRAERSSSSSVSSVCVKEATSLKPNMPAPPLMECATRKMVLTVSESAAPGTSCSSDASMVSRASKLSTKKTSWNWSRSIATVVTPAVGVGKPEQ